MNSINNNNNNYIYNQNYNNIIINKKNEPFYFTKEKRENQIEEIVMIIVSTDINENINYIKRTSNKTYQIYSNKNDIYVKEIPKIIYNSPNNNNKKQIIKKEVKKPPIIKSTLGELFLKVWRNIFIREQIFYWIKVNRYINSFSYDEINNPAWMIRNGHYHLLYDKLQYTLSKDYQLHSQLINMIGDVVIREIAKDSNQKKLLRYLMQKCQRNIMMVADIIDSVAEGGHFEELVILHQWQKLLKWGNWKTTTKAIDIASEKGYFEIVQFLLENRTEGFSEKAPIGASRIGNLKILQLLSIYGEIPYHKCVEEASTYGHLNILIFIFYQNIGIMSQIDIDPETIIMLKGQGHFDYSIFNEYKLNHFNNSNNNNSDNNKNNNNNNSITNLEQDIKNQIEELKKLIEHNLLLSRLQSNNNNNNNNNKKVALSVSKNKSNKSNAQQQQDQEKEKQQPKLKKEEEEELMNKKINIIVENIRNNKNYIQEIKKFNSYSNDQLSTTNAMHNALLNGNIDCVLFLEEFFNQPFELTDELLRDIAMRGNLTILQYLKDHGVDISNCFDPLCYSDNLDLIIEILLVYRDQFKITIKCFDYAAKGNQKLTLYTLYHILVKESEYFKQNELVFMEAMDEAAKNGNLEMLKFLHAFFRGTTNNSIVNAVESGSMETLQWLHSNRLEPITSLSLNRAIIKRNLEMAQFIFDSSKCYLNPSIRHWIKAKGNLQLDRFTQLVFFHNKVAVDLAKPVFIASGSSAFNGKFFGASLNQNYRTLFTFQLNNAMKFSEDPAIRYREDLKDDPLFCPEINWKLTPDIFYMNIIQKHIVIIDICPIHPCQDIHPLDSDRVKSNKMAKIDAQVLEKEKQLEKKYQPLIKHLNNVHPMYAVTFAPLVLVYSPIYQKEPSQNFVAFISNSPLCDTLSVNKINASLAKAYHEIQKDFTDVQFDHHIKAEDLQKILESIPQKINNFNLFDSVITNIIKKPKSKNTSSFEIEIQSDFNFNKVTIDQTIACTCYEFKKNTQDSRNYCQHIFSLFEKLKLDISGFNQNTNLSKYNFMEQFKKRIDEY